MLKNNDIFFFTIYQIARRLLGKILIDLRNTREEAISVADLKSNAEQESTFVKAGTAIEDTDYQRKAHSKNEETKKTSLKSEMSIDTEDDDDKETKYRLDPK